MDRTQRATGRAAVMAALVVGLAIALGLLAFERHADRDEARQTGIHRDGDPALTSRASLIPVPAGPAVVSGSVYVPAYAALRFGAGAASIEFATTLSIHNVSRTAPLILDRIDYHATDGSLVQRYLAEPVALKPLGTFEVFVAAEDTRAGSGANFLIDWSARDRVEPPITEAVMIGAIGNTSYSFVSVGRNAGAAAPEAQSAGAKPPAP